MKNIIIEIHIKIPDKMARDINKRGLGKIGDKVLYVIGEDGKRRYGIMKAARIEELKDEG